MFHFSSTIRIAVGLTCLGISVLLASRALGVGENESAIIMQGRAALAEVIAIQSATLANDAADLSRLRSYLQRMVDRNADLVSIGVRREGDLVVDVGAHQENWRRRATPDSQFRLPIFRNQQRWAEVELRFRALANIGVVPMLGEPSFRQVAFVAVVATLLFTLYLRKMLPHLDPSKVIPDRVRAALDTFAEGLLVLDRNCRIVLANRAFAEHLGESSHELLGRSVSELPWAPRGEGVRMPWSKTLKDGRPRMGVMVDLTVGDVNRCTYMVNCSPITSDGGPPQGVLASFDDVTLHEQRKQELERTLKVLGESREKIRQQNEELRVLATRDPLTGCLNRRSFFESIEHDWQQSCRSGEPISCLMVDVDHFKSINDCYGHALGDEVLRSVGRALQEDLDQQGLVCRYGGEEFCVTFRGREPDEVLALADRIRRRVESLRLHNVSVTVSIGVAVARQFADGFQQLLEQADRSLYVAKHRGRNRVVFWEDVDDVEIHEPQNTRLRDRDQPRTPGDLEIPFHAVTALISALSYRDARTAEHSRRVADLCVGTASSLMSVRELYVLETAALLHDVGKIGVPDAILLKPGPLNDEERAVMRQHDRIGVEIIDTTFACPELLEIVECYRAWFGGHPARSDMPSGANIPLGARILAISDAFDAMVTDRVYRCGRSPEEAFGELRKFAGRQFDPELVELFISTVRDADKSRVSSVDVTKQTALRIGVLTERLTDALDCGDLRDVREQAKRLSLTAREARLVEIAEAASRLQSIGDNDPEAAEIVDITGTLLDLCRTTQKAYLDVELEPRQLREQFASQSFED